MDAQKSCHADTGTAKEISSGPHHGRTWRREALAEFETDFAQDAKGKAVPYGIYDVERNTGYVVVGTSHETPAFAVAALRRGWLDVGRSEYRGKRAWLIQADGGGANGHRCWLWKWGLQQLADEFHVTITVTRYPTGASKWNPIEHRLFSRLSGNWAGQPLLSFEIVLKFIRTIKTATGLGCEARLDRRVYETGLKITPEQKAQVCTRIGFCPNTTTPFAHVVQNNVFKLFSDEDLLRGQNRVHDGLAPDK